jgi:hypothetical protein
MAIIVGAVGTPMTVVFSIVVFAFGFGGTNSPAGACPAGIAVPASVDITPATIEGVNGLKSMYEQVAQDKDLGWPVLAAIDYREDGNDPNRSALSGEPIGSSNPDSGVVTSSKLDSLQQAADHVKAMASSVYGVTLTASSGGDDIKDAFLAYNRGWIYKNANAAADLSPYVLNQYDAAHTDMRWPDVAGEPLAGQTEYGRYGAFTLFVRLGGSTAGGDGCGGLSDDDIVRVAQEQLGLKEVPDGCNCGDEIQKFLGSSAGEFWCADFVSWVYREAGHPFSGGADGGWRLPGVTGMHDWLVNNGEWHDRGGGDQPRPGDVITFRDDEHVGIVEALDGTTVRTIEGNTSNMVARRSYPDGPNNPEIVGWGRMKASSAKVAA